MRVFRDLELVESLGSQKENIIRRVGPDKGGYWEII